MNYTKLVKAAFRAKRNSYSPYSKFPVGAAILTSSGKVFTGCNIEISSYGLTICAERTAIFKALSDGYRSLKAIAVVSDLDDFVPPCGACRQVLVDLAGNIDVIMADNKGHTKVMKVTDLIPLPFTPKMLRRARK